MDEYNWEGINDSLEKDDCEKFEKNNLVIALKVYLRYKTITSQNVSSVAQVKNFYIF